jgi:putative membrane protein
MSLLLIAGTVFAALAALIHLYIFVLESLRWTQESTRRVFGVASAEDARLMKPLAFNQGFYNLFLALGTVTGLVLLLTGAAPQAGLGVAVFALLSMVLAATVLLASNAKMVRAAAIQGLAPLLGLVLLIVDAALSGV